MSQPLFFIKKKNETKQAVVFHPSDGVCRAALGWGWIYLHGCGIQQEVCMGV